MLWNDSSYLKSLSINSFPLPESKINICKKKLSKFSSHSVLNKMKRSKYERSRFQNIKANICIKKTTFKTSLQKVFKSSEIWKCNRFANIPISDFQKTKFCYLCYAQSGVFLIVNILQIGRRKIKRYDFQFIVLSWGS